MKKFFLLVLALLLPPVAVFVKGGVGPALFLNVFFCFAFYLPAIVHALWVVSRRSPPVPADQSGDDFDFDQVETQRGPEGRVEPQLD